MECARRRRSPSVSEGWVCERRDEPAAGRPGAVALSNKHCGARLKTPDVFCVCARARLCVCVYLCVNAESVNV